LSNPLNQVNLSDLVSKDLMEKFHSFLAYTYVTIGQVKGRTLLPLPPQDVTNSERTSSKDKAHILESKSRNEFKFYSGHYPLAKANKERAEAGPRELP
jgi:hypothetical protein